MMKKILAGMMLMALLLSGCSKQPNPGELTQPPQTPSPAPTTDATGEPTPDLSVYSPTTGLALKEGAVYKPIAVMIENAPAARPQTGLQQADIIYETCVESSATRMMCIFNDEYPVVAGPMRSVRIYFINIQREWDSPLVHFGGPSNEEKPVSYVYGKNAEHIKVRVDGVKGKWEKYFWRSSDRKAPHNAYTNVQRIYDELYNYEPQYNGPFAFSANVSYDSGAAFSKVGLSFQTDNPEHTEFKYDADSEKLMRYVNGKEFMVRTVTKDSTGKEHTETSQFHATNLIVQYAKEYIIPNDYSGRRMVEVVGSGKCDYFVAGRHITGTWERKSLDEPTRYYLSNGSPLVLRPGNTWVAIQPDDGKVAIS